MMEILEMLSGRWLEVAGQFGFALRAFHLRGLPAAEKG